eukprot:COSAG04_NODE_56_length_30604_cov_692.571119_47_plen_63_part_00
MENFMKACSLADKKKNGKKVRFMPHIFVCCGQVLAAGYALLGWLAAWCFCWWCFVNSRKRAV